MEFKFRAVDDRAPPTNIYHPSSSTTSCISQQPLRASHTTTPNFIQDLDIYTMQRLREMEKERIRQEIIAEENARRRILEDEIRRELMVEREMAMREAGMTRVSNDEALTMQLNPMFAFMHMFNNHLLGQQFAFPQCHNMQFGLPALPPPSLPQLPDGVVGENKTDLEVDKKDKIIKLAKPDPELCGAKRKAPEGSDELPLLSLKKKPKEEWSCALCKVTATSERGLNEHLGGKKHKNREAGLRAQKTQNCSTASFPKTSGKPVKLTETGETASLAPEVKVQKESTKPNKTAHSSDQKMKATEELKNKNEAVQKKRKRNEGKMNKIVPGQVATAEEAESTPESKKKKFKFWCEVCQTGAHSAAVMGDHKNGKKHMARLKELNQNGEAVPTPTTTIVASSVSTEKAKDVNILAKEAIVSVPTEKAKDLDVMVEEAIVPVPPTEKAKAVDVVAEEASMASSEPTKMERVVVMVAKEASVALPESTEMAQDVDVVAKEAIVTSSEATEMTKDVDVVAKEADISSSEPTEEAKDVHALAKEAEETKFVDAPAKEAIVASSEPIEEAKDVDAAAKEANEGTRENTTGISDGSGSLTLEDLVDMKGRLYDLPEEGLFLNP